MPEHTSTPKPPLSSHINLYISIVRAWIALSREARESLLRGSSIDEFVTAVMQVIAIDHRGDIYQPGIGSMVRDVLPSFYEALRVACRKRGMGEKDVVDYVHDWKDNRLGAKIEYENSLRED